MPAKSASPVHRVIDARRPAHIATASASHSWRITRRLSGVACWKPATTWVVGTA